MKIVQRFLPFGLIPHLVFLLLSSIAEVTRGPWVKFKKDHLWDMPVLNINSIPEDAKKKILNLFDRTKQMRFMSLPQEFAYSLTRKNN